MIGRGLRRDGLAIPGWRVAILQLITVVLMLALLAIWILRVIDVGNDGRAVFVMIMLIILTLCTEMFLIFLVMVYTNTTTLGGAYLKLLEATEPSRLPPASLAFTTVPSPRKPAAAALPAAVLFDIARLGFDAVPDLSMRAALLRGLEIPGFGGYSEGAGT